MEKTGLTHIDDLITQAIAGNGTAFTALWDEYIALLRSFIKGRFKNLDDFTVDDICCRSFEKAFRQIGTYDPSKSQFVTWLRTIAHNTAMDVLEIEGRIHPRNQTIYLDDTAEISVADSIQDQVDTALDSIIRVENIEATEKYINSLPHLYREIAYKRLIEGMQYKEIARELDMELNTVRTRIRRAKKMIDEMSREEDNEL